MMNRVERPNWSVSALCALVPMLAVSCASQPASKPATVPSSGPTSGPSNQPDSHAVYEPTSEPGDGQAYLQRMVGEWEVTKSFFPRDGGAPRVTHGTCSQHMIHGGRFLESDFTFEEDGGKQSTGTGIIGYDPQSKLFTSVWIDSRSTRFSPRKSAEPFDGGRITLEGTAFGQAAGGDGRRSRTVSELLDHDHVLRHQQWSISPENGEWRIMQLEMTRK